MTITITDAVAHVLAKSAAPVILTDPCCFTDLSPDQKQFQPRCRPAKPGAESGVF